MHHIFLPIDLLISWDDFYWGIHHVDDGGAALSWRACAIKIIVIVVVQQNRTASSSMAATSPGHWHSPWLHMNGGGRLSMIHAQSYLYTSTRYTWPPQCACVFIMAPSYGQVKIVTRSYGSTIPSAVPPFQSSVPRSTESRHPVRS